MKWDIPLHISSVMHMSVIVLRYANTRRVRNVRSPEVAKRDEGEEEDEEWQGIAKDLEKPTQFGDENFVLEKIRGHIKQKRNSSKNWCTTCVFTARSSDQNFGMLVWRTLQRMLPWGENAGCLCMSRVRDLGFERQLLEISPSQEICLQSTISV